MSYDAAFFAKYPCRALSQKLLLVLVQSRWIILFLILSQEQTTLFVENCNLFERQFPS